VSRRSVPAGRKCRSVRHVNVAWHFHKRGAPKESIASQAVLLQRRGLSDSVGGSA
jgi:hypothetical protein